MRMIIITAIEKIFFANVIDDVFLVIKREEWKSD